MNNIYLLMILVSTSAWSETKLTTTQHQELSLLNDAVTTKRKNVAAEYCQKKVEVACEYPKHINSFGKKNETAGANHKIKCDAGDLKECYFYQMYLVNSAAFEDMEKLAGKILQENKGIKK